MPKLNILLHQMSKANAGALVILDESKTHAVNHAASIRGIFTERGIAIPEISLLFMP